MTNTTDVSVEDSIAAAATRIREDFPDTFYDALRQLNTIYKKAIEAMYWEFNQEYNAEDVPELLQRTVSAACIQKYCSDSLSAETIGEIIDQTVKHNKNNDGELNANDKIHLTPWIISQLISSQIREYPKTVESAKTIQESFLKTMRTLCQMYERETHQMHGAQKAVYLMVEDAAVEWINNLKLPSSVKPAHSPDTERPVDLPRTAKDSLLQQIKAQTKLYPIYDALCNALTIAEQEIITLSSQEIRDRLLERLVNMSEETLGPINNNPQNKTNKNNFREALTNAARATLNDKARQKLEASCVMYFMRDSRGDTNGRGGMPFVVLTQQSREPIQK